MLHLHTYACLDVVCFILLRRRPPRSTRTDTLFPNTTLFRSPEGLNRGYYVRPTVFANVQPEMRIAREEIFGPVISILGYEDEDKAIELANDTVYGLAAYVRSEERRVGKECVSTCRSRWSPYH